MIIKLKPAKPHLVIFDPRTRKQVPADGLEVDDRLPFWRRRLRDGSMVKVEMVLTPGPDDPALWTAADGGPAPPDMLTPTIEPSAVAGNGLISSLIGPVMKK